MKIEFGKITNEVLGLSCRMYTNRGNHIGTITSNNFLAKELKSVKHSKAVIITIKTKYLTKVDSAQIIEKAKEISKKRGTKWH